MPEDTAQTVGRLAREAGLSSEMEPSWLAQEAVRFVQEDKRYDSQTPYQPENEDFEPIYSRDVMVLGKVIAVIRYY